MASPYAGHPVLMALGLLTQYPAPYDDWLLDAFRRVPGR